MKSRSVALVAASLMLLSACASAPSVCPSPPEPPAPVPLGPSFQDEMQRFLNGSLPEQMSYELRLPAARETRSRDSLNRQDR